MMPIFFHIESHLWIAYLFFFNGVLAQALLRSYSVSYSSLTIPFEAQVLAAFFISISLNGALLLGLDLLDKPFSLMANILLLISIVLALLFFFRARSGLFNAMTRLDIGVWRIVLYGAVFVVLFYNGGLIEQSSDAWWHMSLANKLGIESSFGFDAAHLNGIHERYYPPLWHGNLALATSISDISLPVFWNSFTAWGAVIKVMGFYLFAFSLTRSVAVATLSSILFVLLPGQGVSYLRVSAWPSHIAYTAFFALYYVIFSILDSLREGNNHISNIRQQIVMILVLLALVAIVYLSHQVELVWFVAGLLFYIVGICVLNVLVPSRADQIESERAILKLGMSLIVALVIAAGVWQLIDKWGSIQKSYDLMIASIYPVAFLSFIFYTLLRRTFGNIDERSVIEISVLVAFGFLLVFMVDVRQLLSLFKPELAYPISLYSEYPVAAKGLFGHELSLPGWHLQLRPGLLFSGFLSIPISFGLAYWKTNRATVFLASASILSFLILLSPYLYEWLRQILNYNSAYRISILIFHPIVFSLLIKLCWNEVIRVGEN